MVSPFCAVEKTRTRESKSVTKKKKKPNKRDRTKGIKEFEEVEKSLHHPSVSHCAKQSNRTQQQQHTSKSKMDTFRKWWNKPKVKKNRTAHERRKQN